jgi:hypothetical protein
MKIDFADDFKRIVKEVIGSYMKEMGFKKKGNNFCRPIEDIMQVFTVQQSQGNFAHDKSFTFNLGLFNEEIFKETQEREVPTFPREYDCVVQLRSGILTNGCDKWYELNTKTDLNRLRNEIDEAMRTKIVPFFQTYSTLESMNDLIEKNESIRNMCPSVSRIVLLFKTGRHNKGNEELKKAYLEAKKPRRSKQVINYPDGRTEETFTEARVNVGFVQLLEEVANRYSVKLKEV